MTVPARSPSTNRPRPFPTTAQVPRARLTHSKLPRCGKRSSLSSSDVINLYISRWATIHRNYPIKIICMKISIVIPALNEEAGIVKVLSDIPKQRLNQLGYDLEVIVVDNGSTDRTAEIATKNGARVIPQPLRGYGNAYKMGFAKATGDIIATGDADSTYPFSDLPRILDIMHKTEADFVTTDRLSTLDPKAMTFSHVFGNWLLSITTRILFRWPFKDSQSSMWIFKASIWQSLEVLSPGMPFSQELKVEAWHKGFKCIEVPITYGVRLGEVKLNTIKDGFGNIWQLVKKRMTISRTRSHVDQDLTDPDLTFA